MQLMSFSDFNRLVTTWKNSLMDKDNIPIPQLPGTCWFRPDTDFPSICELKHSTFSELRSESTVNVSPATANEYSSLHVTRTSSKYVDLKENYDIKTIIPSAIVQKTPTDDLNAWTLLYEFEELFGEYYYRLYSEDVDIIFRDMASAKDILRNIYLAELLSEFHFEIDLNGLDMNYILCEPWNYNIFQASSLQELLKQLTPYSGIFSMEDELLCLCAHVVDGEARSSIFTFEDQETELVPILRTG